MKRQTPLPTVWLISDARNDATLEAALLRLPRGSGMIFRHGHLPTAARRARFRALLRLARRRGHLVALAGPPALARTWGAEATYGAKRGAPRRGRLPWLATAHSLAEIGRARRGRAAAVLFSPVFPTRSHPGARALGPVRFLALARHAGVPVIALGGMTAARARVLAAPGRIHGWAAIDGLSGKPGCALEGRPLRA